jgi:hypothetical protein
MKVCVLMGVVFRGMKIGIKCTYTFVGSGTGAVSGVCSSSGVSSEKN